MSLWHRMTEGRMSRVNALVLSRGTIAGELRREELTDANILKLAA